jgi:hypothetical protein
MQLQARNGSNTIKKREHDTHLRFLTSGLCRADGSLLCLKALTLTPFSPAGLVSTVTSNTPVPPTRNHLKIGITTGSPTLSCQIRLNVRFCSDSNRSAALPRNDAKGQQETPRLL